MYTEYSEEDFIADEYFQSWILNSNSSINEFWENWLTNNPEKREVITNAANFVRSMELDEGLSEVELDDMWNNILEQTQDSGGMSKQSRTHFLRGKYFQFGIAALIIGVLVAVFGKNFIGDSSKSILPELPNDAVVLKLQDGSRKVLDEKGSEIITGPKGNVVRQNQNLLIYNETKQNASAIQYNELVVPYGKKFEIELSDGSHVFLNSGTKLKYPVAFIRGRERKVFLDGEAYFSVEKDVKSPFIVVTEDLNTKVYGTKFNVSSYRNEGNTSTVLVEGSVGVYRSDRGDNEAPQTLVPGERAVVKLDKISVDKVNVQKHMAWTEGKLFFVDDEFELILKELERHFNVVINNQIMEMKHKKFTGTFTEESIHDILRIFQQHTSFKYSFNNNEITIYMDDQV
ncbi:MAG: DUF4974 domain-containing protein [Pricia sp.]|nr:DUF4974 domain-containing protein [Pricia sp.]